MLFLKKKIVLTSTHRVFPHNCLVFSIYPHIYEAFMSFLIFIMPPDSRMFHSKYFFSVWFGRFLLGGGLICDNLECLHLLAQDSMWEQHFKNLLGSPPKITDEPITRIISKQLDIKLGPFTKEELDSVLKKIKNRKAAGLDEIPPEVWKTRQFDDILLRQCNAVYSQNRIERWMHPPFP